MTLEHLHQAERHVREAAVHIVNQQTIIETLQRDGLDTAQARAFLLEFEDIQTLHVADRDRLRAELSAAK